MTHPASSISITGIGAVSCAGSGASTLWDALLRDESLIHEGLGTVPENTVLTLRRKLPSRRSDTVCNPSLFAWSAISEAMEQAGWTHLTSRDGLIVGTTTGEIPRWENTLVDFRLGRVSASVCAEALQYQPLSSMLDTLSGLFHFPGESMVVSSACSASSQAIALGALWILQGRVDRCLVGGSEALARLTVAGFKSLQLLSSSPATPFDSARQGINLSEGSGFLCLERGYKPNALAILSGFGFSSDAYHLTAPHPEGSGICSAMRSALLRAGLSPQDIHWIHAHGTGSKANDLAEAAAIRTLFAELRPDEQPWVSSTKGFHGHALGASGALESVIDVLALQNGRVPKTTGLQNPDPAIPLRHPEKTVPQSLGHILKNTLGFGGNNAALILSHPDSVIHPVSTDTRTVKKAASGTSADKDLQAIAKKPEFRKATGNMVLAWSAIEDCLSQTPNRDFLKSPRTGLVLGSNYGELDTTQDFLGTLAGTGVGRPFLFQSSLHNGTVGFLGLLLGIQGPTVTVSNGLKSGESALETGQTLIQAGIIDTCLVVAVDKHSPALSEALRFPDAASATLLC